MGKRVKKGKDGQGRFGVEPDTRKGFEVTYTTPINGGSSVVALAHFEKRSPAGALARKLNQVVRESLFKPKNPGRRSRTKGHSFERSVAIQLRPLFPKARRHLEYQDGECFGVDLANTGEFRIQCKKLKGYAPVATIDEVEYSEALGEVPVLVTEADGKPAMAVLPLADLIRLMGRHVNIP